MAIVQQSTRDFTICTKRPEQKDSDEEVKRRIMLGSFVLSSGYYDAYYLKALRTKALIKQAFDRAFDKYDVILATGCSVHSTEARREPQGSACTCIWAISIPLPSTSGRSSGNHRSVRTGQGRHADRYPDDRRLLPGEHKILRAAYCL